MLLLKLVRLWGSLEEALRGAGPAIAADTPAGFESVYPDLVTDLGAWQAPVAERMADHLAAPGLRVFDAGAGNAEWSLALAARHADIRVTAVDLPAVLPSTRQAVAAAGREDQFEFVASDLFALKARQGAYDLVIAGNVCHLFGEAANRRLIRRLRETLRPGGTLAILDVLPNEQLDGPPAVALYALGLLLRTSEGTAYPFSSYVAWLHATGYEAIERIDLGAEPPISLITAQRPHSDWNTLRRPMPGGRSEERQEKPTVRPDRTEDGVRAPGGGARPRRARCER